MSDYTPTGKPQEGSRYVSKDIRDEFILIKNSVNSKADFTTPVYTTQVTYNVSPIAPTPASGDNSTKVATTEFVQDATLNAALPTQTGNSGKFLTTNGTDSSWGTVSQVPSQTTHSGKYLTTDGSTSSWGTISVVPDQSGHSGKVLTTNGTAASWTADFADLGSNTFTGAQNTARATVAAHATTADIWSAAGNEIDFTGTATITDFPDAPQAGASRILHIASTPTFTNNANITIHGGANYTAAAGDTATIHALTVSTFKLIPPAPPANSAIDLWGTAASTKYPVSAWEKIVNTSNSTGLGGTYSCVSYSGSEDLFIASDSSAANTFVASSVDGSSWTLRDTTSSGKWAIGSDGVTFLMCDLTPGLTIKTPGSSDWTSGGTNLPGNPNTDARNAPVSPGLATFLICGASGTIYRTTNRGGIWTSETFPGTGPGALFWIADASLLWGYSATTTAYTSATGTTGSWTARTLPEAPSSSTSFWMSFGYLCYRSTTDKIYITNDAINWTDISITHASSIPLMRINGVYGVIDAVRSYNVYNGVTVNRSNSDVIADSTTMRSDTNGNGTYLISQKTSDSIIVINGSDKAAFI